MILKLKEKLSQANTSKFYGWILAYVMDYNFRQVLNIALYRTEFALC